MIGPRIGPRPGRVGLAVGLGEDGIAPSTVVSADPTSGKKVPASAVEWALFRSQNSLVVASPDYLHLCQEAAGNLADSIGAATLTALNSPLYAQAVTGWSRVGVKGNQTSQQRFMYASGPNPSTTSIARFCFFQCGTVDATPRQIMGCGAVDDVSVSVYLSSSKARLRYRESANITDAAAANDYSLAVHPLLLLSDVTNSRARLYTDLEKLSPTFGLGANATNYSLGSLATGTFSATTIIYECGWQGANAETCTDASVKAFFQALGYSIPWS